MKNLKTYSTSNWLPVLLLSVILISVLGFKTEEKSFESKEYLSMVVEYDWIARKITLSSPGAETKKMVYFPKGLSDRMKKKFITPTIQWEERSFKGLFDDQFVLEKIIEFEKEGWSLSNQSFAIGKSAMAAEAESSMRHEEEDSEYISYFLFVR